MDFPIPEKLKSFIGEGYEIDKAEEEIYLLSGYKVTTDESSYSDDVLDFIIFSSKTNEFECTDGKEDADRIFCSFKNSSK